MCVEGMGVGVGGGGGSKRDRWVAECLSIFMCHLFVSVQCVCVCVF